MFITVIYDTKQIHNDKKRFLAIPFIHCRSYKCNCLIVDEQIHMQQHRFDL